jgi:hypothetical protein
MLPYFRDQSPLNKAAYIHKVSGHDKSITCSEAHHPQACHDQSLNSSARDGNLQIIVRAWDLQLRFYNELVIRDCLQKGQDA